MFDREPKQTNNREFLLSNKNINLLTGLIKNFLGKENLNIYEELQRNMLKECSVTDQSYELKDINFTKKRKYNSIDLILNPSNSEGPNLNLQILNNSKIEFEEKDSRKKVRITRSFGDYKKTTELVIIKK